MFILTFFNYKIGTYSRILLETLLREQYYAVLEQYNFYNYKVLYVTMGIYFVEITHYSPVVYSLF